MTDKEFRRLSRGKLIELILAQGREIRRLEEELEETESCGDRRTCAGAAPGDPGEGGPLYGGASADPLRKERMTGRGDAAGK